MTFDRQRVRFQLRRMQLEGWKTLFYYSYYITKDIHSQIIVDTMLLPDKSEQTFL